MSLASDIKALKARCTALESRCVAIEAKDRSQDTTVASTRADVAALTARVSALEAVTHADHSAEIAKLREEVDALTTWLIYNVNDYPPGQPPLQDYYNAVTDGGCDNEGSDDCVADILDAVTAYKAAGKDGLYFPAGTYLLSSTLTVPSGTVFVGSGLDTAQLKGAVVYNSNSSFTDLKIGDSGVSGIHNGVGASTTTFTRCQFRGGVGNHTAPVRFGSGSASADHITFTDCNIERNLENAEDSADNNSNNVIWIENCSTTGGAHMEYITFTGCHFGVDNGRRDIERYVGSPRANVEMWNMPISGNTGARYGWDHVYFYDCVFEAADWFTLDIHSTDFEGAHTDAYCVVDGCTIYGGGATGADSSFGYSIAIEGANYVTVNDCDIYPSYATVLETLMFHGIDCHDWAITNNRFHLDDYTHGNLSTRSTDPVVVLTGTGVFTGNTVHNSLGSYWLFWLGYYYSANTPSADACTVTGNEFHELRSTATAMMRVYNATDCTITGNTLQTEATSGPTVTYSGTNTGTTVVDGENNTLIHA